MTRTELIRVIANSIAHREGYYITAQQAQKRGMKWPTRAQRNNNPGNLRRWSRSDVYDSADPKNRYVIFPSDKAGWAALHELCDQYMRGRYHGARKPSLREWFKVYAPAEDSNDPASYAAGVAKALTAAGVRNVTVDRPVAEFIDEG